MNFVPDSAEVLESSKEFALKYTTSRGTSIYIRDLTEEEADSIVIGSSDDTFLSFQDHAKRLMVTVKDHEIVEGMSDDPDDTLEILAFMGENNL